MSKPSQKLLDEAFYTFKKNAGEGLCWVRGCRRKSKSDRSICHMHEMRRWRSKNDLTHSYCNLRDHARGRGIEFSISPDYWLGLTDAFSFYKQEDPSLTLTIDRVNPVKGYVPGNLRVITVAENSRKGALERYLPEHVQEMIRRKRDEEQEKNMKYLLLGEPKYLYGPDQEFDFEDNENPF